MSRPTPLAIIETAIAGADTSYFFENYTKQAQAVLAALEHAGYRIIPQHMPDTVWKQVADSVRTGRLRPEDHVKDVYQTLLRVTGGR